MNGTCSVNLQCAGAYTGKVSVSTLEDAGSVGEARRVLLQLTGILTLESLSNTVAYLSMIPLSLYHRIFSFYHGQPVQPV